MTRRIFLLITVYFSLLNAAVAEIPEILINPSNEQYTRLSSGLAGANITIINADEIQSQPNKNLPQILEMYSGIEIRRLYDGIEGTNSSIDMRGFGEASKSNVLILINGIRLNEIDMANVSFSHIPLNSIERVEIVRGGSAATLYGSGAVGGAINIVTKNDMTNNSLNLSVGSYNTQKANFNLGTNLNDTSSLTLFGSGYSSDTFRDAADYENQNFVLNYQNNFSEMKLNLDIFSSNKDQNLPGPRVKGGAVYNYHFCNRYEDSRTAKNIGGSNAENGNTCDTTQRDDYADSENSRINLNLDYDLDDSNKLIANIGYKDREDKAFLAANGNTLSTPNDGDRYIHTKTDGNIFNSRYENRQVNENYSNILNLGFEIGHSFYNSKRYRNESESLGQEYHSDLKSRSFYIQNTFYHNEYDLALSFGARQESTETSARDELYPVTGFAYETDRTTYNNDRNNYAYNIGFEKVISKSISLYGSYSEAFRIPNIDEIILATTSGSFHLEDQESDGIEIGVLYQSSFVNLNASYYIMDTKNEIQYNQSVNTNLDPIEREGINIDMKYTIDQKQKITTSINHTEAEFTSGSLSMGTGTFEYLGVTYYSGNQTYGYGTSTAINYLGSNGTANQSISLAGRKVPLVPPLTFSINYERQMYNEFNFNIGLKYTDERYVSNDQENIEPKIPDYYQVDSSISKSFGPYLFAIGINNLLNEKIYDFVVSSIFHNDAHYGLSNVYPLPERNFFIDFKYTF